MSNKRKGKKAVKEEDVESPTSAYGSDSSLSDVSFDDGSSDSQDEPAPPTRRLRGAIRRGHTAYRNEKASQKRRRKLESYHPQLLTMWKNLEEMPPLKAGKAEQPKSISRVLKGFQLEGLAWMKAMEEKTEWKGGLLGDEMGLGKTIQAVRSRYRNRT